MQYNELLMLRVVNRDHRLANIYLERLQKSPQSEALKQLFQELIPNDLTATTLYREQLGQPDRTHVIVDTPTSHAIDVLIKMYGWIAFKDGFELYAKNKEQLLISLGLTDASRAWHKIADTVSAIVKYPQE